MAPTSPSLTLVLLINTVTLRANIQLLEWQYFGLKEEQAPLILIQDGDSKKFLKDHIEADQIVSWLKEYFVSIALNFNALLWYFVWFHMILELIDPFYL